ncbi:hypothetical protein DPEC_G00288280 [Dallia pectoralis]|uniref:Uncharacterized protein n=1 Tax=Dallia pectoralis TaxID=75939 RepID=A0ACC2FKF7_DALPE|nr:hypothetical protein DPEC_G00288280 [Dallia pectoralis]
MSPSKPATRVSTPSETESPDLTDGATVGRRKMQRLATSKITQVDFLPREVVLYCKETQTPVTETAHLSAGEEEDDEEVTDLAPVPESDQLEEVDTMETKEGERIEISC